MKIKISRLTRRELEAIKAEANFTAEQLKIFEALNSDEVYDYAIMRRLSMSQRKYYELKKITVEKVHKIALELGYDHVINVKEKRN